jgi:amino acid adenylation domain-containing protein
MSTVATAVSVRASVTRLDQRQAGVVQERLWLLSELAEFPSAYCHALAIRIGGPLDADALSKALRNVVQRNDALRERFALEDGVVVVETAHTQIAPPTVEDLSDLAATARRAELARIRATELRRPFDLASEPPVRFRLTRLKQHQHELLVLVHHIAADQRSAALLAEEIVAQYRAAIDERPLPDVRSYRDNFPEHDELAEDLDFWRGALSGLPDPVPLPHQQGRPEADAQAADQTEFGLAPAVTDLLTALAEQNHTDLATIFIAALAVVLHRSLRISDLTIGILVSGRDADTERTIGPLDEAKPLRLRLPYDPTWREVIELVSDQARLVAAHSRTPFHRMVEMVGVKPGATMHPIFQVLVRNASAALAAQTVSGVTFTPSLLDTGRSSYDAELLVPGGAAPRSGALRYARGLFSPDGAESVVALLRRTLRQLAADPDARVSASALVADDERDKILYSWNNTAVDFPGDVPVHHLYEQWADRTPDAPALWWEGTGYSYAELDRRANQLAHALAQLGVAKETRVGLYFGYTAEWVVSALATLKVGGVYVPLDLSYPSERLATMCQTADVALVLAHTMTGALPGFPAEQQLFVDVAPVIDSKATARSQVDVAPDQLAYIMFTSGSTGAPKGIGVTHRNVVRTVRGIGYTRFGPGDSVAQGSNISFDATTLETWGALLNGARLVGLRKEDLLEPHRLREQITSHEIDMMFLPAALMKQLVAEEPATFESLQYFQSGGEQADFLTLERILEYGAPEHLINPYGPTETTVNAAAYLCNNLTDVDRHVPIGFPLANTACYVLDQYLQPVPVGLTGELFVGGPGVSRGYLSQPALTSETFVPSPFSDQPGARMYRTGDLARYRADGAIEFLGRADRQVKIRGFRVEPGEVETAILRSHEVREVSVQVSTDAAGDQVLVAYVVPAGPELDQTSLRNFVREQVPIYMTPGLFVQMKSLPLNANGKLDVSALRALTPMATSDSEVVEPQTATEGRLDMLITELLGVGHISVHDDFFRLGGDSLQAISLVAKARRIFQVEIPVSAFLREPTVAVFAAGIDHLRAAKRSGSQASQTAQPTHAARPAFSAPSAPPAPAAPPVPAVPALPKAVAAAAPASTVSMLLQIWREVLDAPSLGIDDNFFLMGGHSLKVTRVASRVRAALGVDPPLRLLFANPTVGSFAAALDAISNQAADPPAPDGGVEPAAALARLLDSARQSAADTDGRPERML